MRFARLIYLGAPVAMAAAPSPEMATEIVVPQPKVVVIDVPIISVPLPVKPPEVKIIPPRMLDDGKASWYGPGDSVEVAAGGRFNPWGMTAAHRTWKFGTKVLVKHGDKSVVVEINDRGPAKWTGRFIDLSLGAFRKLADPSIGEIDVKVFEIKTQPKAQKRGF